MSFQKPTNQQRTRNNNGPKNNNNAMTHHQPNGRTTTVKVSKTQTKTTYVQNNLFVTRNQNTKTSIKCSACVNGIFNNQIHRRCNGLGYVNIDKAQYRICNNCMGYGIVESTKFVIFTDQVLCSICQGLGLVKIKN